MQKPRVLVFLGRYLPGFNSGGPVRTISCMVEALAHNFDFYIVTLNCDSGSKKIYTEVRTGAWNRVGSANVFYTPRFGWGLFQTMLAEVKPDAIYFNGFFSTSSVKGLFARRMGKLDNVPVVLATRGDLSQGALSLKSAKKHSYMAIARGLGVYRNLLWHASSEREQADILREMAPIGVRLEDIHIAPDLGFGYADSPAATRPHKSPGEARFVTLGRITRMKNLLFTIERLAELRGNVSLDIFGPMENRELWAECQARIATLPPNIRVRYHGPLEPSGVLGELSQRHFFILSTLGENYGHVIIEGAAAGCPVVISDRTQWQGLAAKNVGWDLSLDCSDRWREILQSCVEMGNEEYITMSADAREFAQSVMQSRENIDANFNLFRRAVGMVPTLKAASAEVSR